MFGSTLIDSGGTPVRTEVYEPAGGARGAAVVIVHGSDGMRTPWAETIREFASGLADRGIAAYIPSYFDKTGTVPGSSVLAQNPKMVDRWVEAVSDVLANVKTRPGVAPDRVGLLGFSLGGHIGLRLRHSTSALVEFFAPELLMLGGIGSSQASALQAQIHHGSADEFVRYAESESIAAKLQKDGAAVTVFRYDEAGHGFAGADANNATARRSSKTRTMAFFEQALATNREVCRAS